MIIPILHQSPHICAQQYADQHLSKITLELPVILATVHRLVDGRSAQMMRANMRGTFLYQFTLPEEIGKSPIVPMPVNHAGIWVLWAKESSDNYTWLAALYLACCREWSFRFGHSHGAARWLRYLQELPSFFQSDEMTDWPVTVPGNNIVAYCCNEKIDVVQSYRWFYSENMLKYQKWTKRQKPIWIAQQLGQQPQKDTTTETGQRSGSDQLTLFS